jgi:magnesium and cobalt exporter, CNNM family
MDVVTIVAKIVAVLGLVFLNGFFVAAEFAIVKVRSTQIEPLAKTGSKRARIAQSVITHLDSYLSATQLGITLTSLGLGWLGEPFVAHLIGPVFTGMGVSEPAYVQTASFAIGFFIITFLHIVFGELAPKSLAIRRAQSTTLTIATPLHLFFVVFRPFIWVLNETANYFLRKAGIAPVSEADMAHSEEELRLLLSKGKALSAVGKAISLRAFELRDRTVREIMVPRTEVFFLSTERSIKENVTAALENQYTRYPLCQQDLDNVLGMIHVKDLFALKGTDGPGTKLLDIKHEMLFVPETTPVEKMLSSFLARRLLMAIAVDEYGGTAGLVTLENVLEELVGEIRDEFDVEPLPFQKISDTEYLIDGTMPLHDFARMFEITPEGKDAVTVSGYILHLLERIPEKGATVRIGGWDGTILAVHGKIVKTLRLRKRAESTTT